MYEIILQMTVETLVHVWYCLTWTNKKNSRNRNKKTVFFIMRKTERTNDQEEFNKPQVRPAGHLLNFWQLGSAQQ